jgi:pimeloyl-ACP methyl ester carboxylesterase
MADTPPDLAGVEHRYVDVNGFRMHYAEAGAGEPVLMLHGWPQHWYMWRHLIPVLSPGFRVICPDLRGFGWSEAPPGRYEKEQLADDILALMDALDLKRVRLVGHDWGGWVGFLLCLRAPERFDRYLVLNMTHPFQHPDMRLIDTWRFWYQWLLASPWLGSWILRRVPDFVRKVLIGGMHQPNWTRSDLNLYARRFQEPARAAASVQLYRSFTLREIWSAMAGRYRRQRLTVPTHLLFGERDPAITKRMLRGYEPYADRMTVEFVPDCGHFIAEEQPERVAAVARAFLAGATPVGGA